MSEFPKWVHLHPSHDVRDFVERHIDRVTGSTLVLVNDEAEEAKATSEFVAPHESEDHNEEAH